MKRRRALLAVAAGIAALPLDLFAQAAAKSGYRVGLMFTTSPVSEMAGDNPSHPAAKAFLHELRARGYVEGKNLILERRSAEGKFERFADILTELIRLKPDVIVTTGDELAKRAGETTTTIPIVMATSRYPVEFGIVQSLARPGGNVTGLSSSPGPEIEAKRLELLTTAIPKISRVAFLGGKADWESPNGKTVQDAARTLGIILWLAEHTPDEYRHAFALIARERPDAIFVANSPQNFAHRRAIVEFAAKNRLSGSYSSSEFVEVGGLMSYGVNLIDRFRRAAIYVDKILKGAKPSDLPIEQPTKFELVINLKTAKALGLSVSQEMKFRADRVIE